jgi:hypothetical protein
MSIVKYSTSNVPNTIRANNVAVGINNVGYGPTNTTGFYSGINVPSGGYVIYRFPGGAGQPNVYVAQNDTELINLAGRSNATTVAQAISHINGLSNTIIMDRNYENIVTDGLVLCLDAGTLMSYLRSGTTWRDISGNGNNGTLINGPTFNSGNGGSIVFDGVNDYVRIPYTVVLAPPIISFNSWVYSLNWVSKNNNQKIFSKTQNGGYAFGCGVFTTTNVEFAALIGGAYRIVSYPLNSLSIGWVNFQGTFDGRYLKLYINGVLVSTYDHTSISNISYSDNNQLVIGAEPGSGTGIDGNFFSGNISQTLIYNRALSATEIQQNYNATKSRFGL